MALYFTGQTEKAKQEAEKVVNEFTPQGEFDHSEYYAFFNYVYNETTIEADKEWAEKTNKVLIGKMAEAFPEKFTGERAIYYTGFSPFYRTDNQIWG